MNKIKTFLFSTVPLLLGIGMQYVAMIYLMIISAILMFIISPIVQNGKSAYTNLMELWMDMNFNTIIMIVFSISCVALFGLWYYKSCGGNFRPGIKKSFHPLQLAGIVFMIPGTQFFTSILISYVSVIFPSWLEAYEELLESAGLGEEVTILMMIYSVCLAPISEELIFRGVTMRVARRAFPFWAANLIQAVLFGVFHMNMIQGIYAAALGLFLGYVCERGGTIYHAMLFHFLFNLWGTTSSSWLNVENPALATLIVFGGTIIGLSVGFPLFVQGTKRLKTAQ